MNRMRMEQKMFSFEEATLNDKKQPGGLYNSYHSMMDGRSVPTMMMQK